LRLALRRIVEQVDQLFFHGRHDAFASKACVQPSRDREHTVANLFGGQSTAGEAPEETIVGIDQFWILNFGFWIGVAGCIFL
jgi:hypothetical protein